jgi:hypothetical protein
MTTFNSHKLHSHHALPKHYDSSKFLVKHSDVTSTGTDNGLLGMAAFVISSPSSFIFNRWAGPVAYIAVHPNPAEGLAALPSEILAGNEIIAGTSLFGMSGFFPVISVFAL